MVREGTRGARALHGRLSFKRSERLSGLQLRFESQRCKVFFGASVLIVYDAAAHSSADLCQSLAVKVPAASSMQCFPQLFCGLGMCLRAYSPPKSVACSSRRW